MSTVPIVSRKVTRLARFRMTQHQPRNELQLGQYTLDTISTSARESTLDSLSCSSLYTVIVSVIQLIFGVPGPGSSCFSGVSSVLSPAITVQYN